MADEIYQEWLPVPDLKGERKYRTGSITFIRTFHLQVIHQDSEELRLVLSGKPDKHPSDIPGSLRILVHRPVAYRWFYRFDVETTFADPYITIETCPIESPVVHPMEANAITALFIVEHSRWLEAIRHAPGPEFPGHERMRHYVVQGGNGRIEVASASIPSAEWVTS